MGQPTSSASDGSTGVSFWAAPTATGLDSHLQRFGPLIHALHRLEDLAWKASESFVAVFPYVDLMGYDGI